MQSDGGLAPTNRFSGHRAVLSGPAGGYVGYALTTKWHGYNAEKLQLIGFDMGGTSTDVSRFAGSYEHVFEATLAGQLPPQLSSQPRPTPSSVCDLCVDGQKGDCLPCLPFVPFACMMFHGRLQHILVTNHICCCTHWTATHLLLAMAFLVQCDSGFSCCRPIPVTSHLNVLLLALQPKHTRHL